MEHLRRQHELLVQRAQRLTAMAAAVKKSQRWGDTDAYKQSQRRT